MHQNQNSCLLCSMSSHQQTRNFFIQIRSVATKTNPATHMANPVQLQPSTRGFGSNCGGAVLAPSDLHI